MDVAKRLAEWRDQPPEQWFSAANRYLPPGLTTVLVIAIAYQLATLTWRWYRAPPPSRRLRRVPSTAAGHPHPIIAC